MLHHGTDTMGSWIPTPPCPGWAQRACTKSFVEHRLGLGSTLKDSRTWGWIQTVKPHECLWRGPACWSTYIMKWCTLSKGLGRGYTPSGVTPTCEVISCRRWWYHQWFNARCTAWWLYFLYCDHQKRPEGERIYATGLSGGHRSSKHRPDITDADFLALRKKAFKTTDWPAIERTFGI